MVLAVLAGILTGLLSAAPQGSAAEGDGWAALRRPGTHALMRHARAPGTGDPPGFKLGDCATQRNLDASGRAQARRIGEGLRRHGIVPDLVLTSAWCRSSETARLLGAGPVSVEPLLNSFFGQDGREGEQTRQLLARIAGLGTRKAIMVTHQVNITALTGINPASGEIVVVATPSPGKVAVVGRIRVD